MDAVRKERVSPVITPVSPEWIAARFKEAGYHFIAFTEHDRLQEGEAPALEGRQPGSNGRGKTRLKTLAEYRETVEEPGLPSFLPQSGTQNQQAHGPGP